MNIAFVTTQTIEGSTVLGRVLPLAQQLAHNHSVHVLVHGPDSTSKILSPIYKIHVVGADPFVKGDGGKKRLAGIFLLLRMKWNAIFATIRLLKIRPDVVVIVKSLPESVLVGWLYSLLRKSFLVLDADDFELTANKLTSIWQRAAVHWAERTGAKIAKVIVTASPFLQDHFQQLVPHKKVLMIPTGITQRSQNDQAKSNPVKTPKLIYTGSVSIASGHRVDLLPEILEHVRKQLPQATLTIAGSGDDIEDIKKDFANRNLTEAVFWLGRFASSDIPKIFSTIAIAIDPIDASISNRAKSSFRVLVAQQYGLPVITSNVGVRPDLIPREFHDRFFATPGDTVSYADKIISMFATPLSPLEINILQHHVDQFTWPILAKQYNNIWSS
ncbi:MAG: glycosyltransferase [Candidatus Andersenbacteria bacterium]|nr:glycosyltransferase [Candidatus Andersenbacteria bacterium]MBI3250281.1 glycosyltransferase [Candidatus Andersenbacteria bacterium]